MGNPNQAGLAQAVAAAGNLPIGAAMFMQGGHDVVRFADKSVWLRAGVLAAASLYPLAARLEHLGAHAFSSVTNGSSNAPTTRRIATDGNGRYMVADQDVSNLRVSSDYGKTWANVAHNLPNAVSDIIFANGVWIAVSNNTAAAHASVSSNGTSFGAAAVVMGMSNASANSAQIAYSGAVFYVACASADGNVGFSTNNGASWGTRTIPQITGTGGANSFALGAGGGRAIITIGTSSTGNNIVDGSNGTTAVFPITTVAGARPAYINGAFLLFTSTTAYVRNTAVDVYSAQIVLPSPNALCNAIWARVGNRIIYTGFATSGFSYTSDGLTWGYQASTTDTANLQTVGLCGDAKTLLLSQPSVAGVLRAESSIDAPNYVGRSIASGTPNTQISGAVLYNRVA